MIPEPITSATIASLTSQAIESGKNSLFWIFTSLRDICVIKKFKFDLFFSRPNQVIFNDIVSIESRLLNALHKNDISRMNYLIINSLNESYRLDGINQVGLELKIQRCLAAFSNHPLIIEEGLFTIFALYWNSLKTWEEKFGVMYSIKERDFAIPKKYKEEECFLDPTIQSAFIFIGIFYRLCIKIGERSQENLIRISIFFHQNAAADISQIYSTHAFSRFFLAIIIQIATRAHINNLEPIRDKSINILKFANQKWVEETFESLKDYDSIGYVAIMGNMREYLATSIEIQSFKKYYNQKVS